MQHVQLNPYIYPDVNWGDLIFKDFAVNQRANLSVQGGGTKATYFMSIQVNHDTGLLSSPKIYSFDNNINNLGLNFQNNIAYKVTPTTKVELRMNAQIRQSKGPGYSTADLFKMCYTVNPIFSQPISHKRMEMSMYGLATSGQIMMCVLILMHIWLVRIKKVVQTH